jgi:hypothetical protein
VVFFTKEGLEKWKKQVSFSLIHSLFDLVLMIGQERAKKQERGRTGGKSRAARTAAWKRGGGRERRADGRFRA